jgi:hypothetical protein
MVCILKKTDLCKHHALSFNPYLPQRDCTWSGERSIVAHCIETLQSGKMITMIRGMQLGQKHVSKLGHIHDEDCSAPTTLIFRAHILFYIIHTKSYRRSLL